MEDVAIVILNYNGRAMLQNFLPTVLQHSFGYKVIVADNASTDDSVAYLKTHFPEVEHIQMLVNKGFAGGYNEALAHLKANYYILLNSDVEVTENWITPVIQEMKAKNWVAAQPKILAQKQKSHFEYAGAAGGYLDKLGYAFCRGRIFDTAEVDENQYNTNKEIFWATGACMFIDSGVYHQMGGFDADFFAHMEEIDLCWRIQQAGFKIGYVAQSTVYHVGGATLHKSNPFKTFLNFRNSLWMMTKNLPQNQLYQTLFIRMCLDGVAAIQFLIKGNFSDFKAVFNAHIAFYNKFFTMLAKRKLIHKTGNKIETIYPKSIIIEYFIKKKTKFKDLNWL